MSDEKKELTDEEMEKTAGGYDGRVFGCDYINSEGQQCCCTFSNMLDLVRHKKVEIMNFLRIFNLNCKLLQTKGVDLSSSSFDYKF